MLKRGIFVFVCLALFAGCKKEFERPQWDVALLGPIAKGTLGIRNLTSDTLLKVNPDSSVTLIYNKNFYSLAIDSLLSIPDTIVNTTVPPNPVPVPFNITPGSILYQKTDETKLAVNNVQLRSAIVKTGKVRFTVTNRLHTKVLFTYNIPGASKNGSVFNISAAVDSATAAGPGVYINEYDLSGYFFDLTGTAGNKVNSISFFLEAKSDPNGPLVVNKANDTALFIQNGFVDIVPYYAKGYLGQTTLTVGPDSSLLDLFENVKSGMLSLNYARLKLTIENDIGMDAQLKVGSLTSVNTRTNTSVNLAAPSIIGQTLNINRAGAAGTTTNPSYIPSFYTVEIDNANSNFKSLLENLPDYLVYDLNLKTNPLGNVSGSNDFAFADHLVNVNLNMEIPLNLAADQLTMSDTADFSLSGDSTVNNLGAGAFIFNVNNGFPFDLRMTLTTLNEQNQFLDKLIDNGLAAAPPLDGNLKAVGKKLSQFIIPVDDARTELLRQAKKMVVTAAYTTAAGTQQVKIYADYTIDFKLIADIKYHVR